MNRLKFDEMEAETLAAAAVAQMSYLLRVVEFVEHLPIDDTLWLFDMLDKKLGAGAQLRGAALRVLQMPNREILQTVIDFKAHIAQVRRMHRDQILDKERINAS
jgi:hypothetical protein